MSYEVILCSGWGNPNTARLFEGQLGSKTRVGWAYVGNYIDYMSQSYMD